MKLVTQKVIVAAAIVHTKKVLIVQRSPNEKVFPSLWEIPSGKREHFESSLAAIVREVKEETSLEVKPVKPIDVFEFKVERDNEIRDSTQITFLCKLFGNPKVTISDEHQDFDWITKDQVKDYNLSKDLQRVIKKAFEESVE